MDKKFYFTWKKNDIIHDETPGAPEPDISMISQASTDDSETYFSKPVKFTKQKTLELEKTESNDY